MLSCLILTRLPIRVQLVLSLLSSTRSSVHVFNETERKMWHPLEVFLWVTTRCKSMLFEFRGLARHRITPGFGLSPLFRRSGLSLEHLLGISVQHNLWCRKAMPKGGSVLVATSIQESPLRVDGDLCKVWGLPSPGLVYVICHPQGGRCSKEWAFSGWTDALWDMREDSFQSAQTSH